MKILFITSTRLGDAVLSTGLLGHLLGRHPEARVTVACGPVAHDLFAACPSVERVIPLRKGPFARHWRRLWQEVAATRWDIVVDLRNSIIPWVVRRDRAFIKRGKARKGEQIPAELARVLDINPPPDPVVWTTAKAEARAAALLPDGAPLLMLSPAAQWIPKTWPAGHYAELAGRLTAPAGPFPGGRIAVMASAAEEEQARAVWDRLPFGRRVDLIGNTDVIEAIACFRRTALFVGNDTGLMHLAAAAGTPTLGLFGPTDETRYAPWGDRAGAVRTPEPLEALRRGPAAALDSRESLMASLSVDTVAWAATTLLKTLP